MFSHLDARNQPVMVDVGDKAVTRRTAHAVAVVTLPGELAALLPSVDALADKVTEFHKALVSQPFPVIVTTNYDGLVEATLQALVEPYRLVVEEAEVAPALAANDGCRVVVKMHGDLLLDGAAQCRGEQFLLRTEVVHETVDADTQRRGHRAQRGLGQAVLRQVDDDAVEEFLAALEIGGACHGGAP